MDILARGAAHLGRTAVTAGGRKHTYANVLDASERLSSAVSRLVASRSRGGESPRVGLYASPGAEYLAATLAVWRAGGIVVPLAASHPPRELEYVLQDAGVSAVLTPEEFAPKVEGVSAMADAAMHVIEPVSGTPYDAAAAAPATSHDRAQPVEHSLPGLSPSEASQGALIIYTSGTTGKPKGVLHTHGSLGAQVRGLTSAWQWCSSDVILHNLPLHHIHGIVNALYCPAYVGAQVHFLPAFSATKVWEEIMSGRVNIFMGVPTMYSYLLSHYDARMSDAERVAAQAAAAALRLTVSGSSACPVPVQERWRSLTGAYLLERYGMTEIGMALSNPYAGAPRVPGAVGLPLPGVSVRIADDSELLVRGDNVFKEYWGREAATAEAFTPDGWFRTGDSADVLTVAAEDGNGSSSADANNGANGASTAEYYRILGRTSVDIIKSAGYKLSALMIESAIMEHPGVSEVAVLGVPDDTYGEVVTALVGRQPSHPELGQRELTGFCRERLASYQCPKRWHFVDKLPRNAMGKLNKKELLKQYLDEKAQEGGAKAVAQA